MAAIAFERGKHGNAILLADSSMQFGNNTEADLIINSSIIQGAALNSQMRFIEAEHVVMRAINLAIVVKSNLQCLGYVNLARIYRDQKNWSKALEYVQIALDSSILGTPADRLNAIQVQAEVLNNKGDYQRAIVSYEIYHNKRDSILHSTDEALASYLHSRYNSDLKEAEIISLKEQEAHQSTRIQRDTVVIVFGLTVMAALGAIIYLLWQRNGLRKRENSRLTQENVKSEAQKTSLQANNVLKNKLLSIITHDFREPLNSLQSLVTMVESGSLDDEEATYVFAKVHDDIERTSSLLNDLLVWAKSQMLDLRPNMMPLPLSRLVQDIVGTLNSIANAEDVRLEIHIDPTLKVMADKDLLSVIIRNLTINAIKYSPSGQAVVIAASQKEGSIYLTIKDNGPGIDPLKLSYLWDVNEFSQLTNGRTISNGLGLMLVKEFTDLMGGTLNFESAPGQGATFYLSYKQADSQSIHIEEVLSNYTSGPNKKELSIEV